MSDIPVLSSFLPDYVTQDIRGLSVQPWRNNKLNYVLEQKQKNNESFCCIDIPLSMLLCWATIQKNSTDFLSFVKLLNENIPGCGFAVKQDAARIEERLRVKCSFISNRFKAASGRKKKRSFVGELQNEHFCGRSGVS